MVQANKDEPLLEFRDVTLRYGAVTALDDVTFAVQEGQLFALVGPNGAGKTSAFNCINGLDRPQTGAITFDGLDLATMSPDAIARAGIARMFQNLALYRNTPVLANVMAGRHHLMTCGVLAGMLFWGRSRKEQVEHRHRVEEILDFLQIDHLRDDTVDSLPYGLQKRVELARALAMEPRLLLLDEPAAGMNQEETEDMARFILDVVEEWGITVLLIEHDMGVVMDLADRIAVLDSGQVIAVGTPDEVQQHPAVIAAYLGDEDWTSLTPDDSTEIRNGGRLT